MASNILSTLLFFILCIGVSSQVGPVYQPGGARPPPPSKIAVAPTVKATPRSINTAKPRRNKLVTETVYGFLDFTTTVGSTVMVFTPQSEKEKGSSPTSKVVAVITATPTTARSTTTTTTATTTTTVRTTKTTTKAKVEATKPPEIKAKKVITATSTSSTSAPSGLAKLLREALLSKDERPFSFSSRPLRNSYKYRKNGSSGSRNRDFIPFNNRKSSSSGGSTIVPITVEGKGGALPPKTPVLEPSIYIPEEIVVSASQNFPPLSAVGPFNTEVNNDIENSYRYDYIASEPAPSISEDYSLVDLESSALSKPTGLVTTLGGTIISDGQTTIHKTSVIGTYVSGKYAQVLKSTSRIFQENPSENLITPTQNNYETVKSVIEGSATQFFKPEPTASLPIESLFSSAPERVPRYENKQEDLPEAESKLTKRRGTNPYVRDDYYYYYDSKDQFYDDEYDDLVRAGSGLRPSFRPASPPRSISSSPTFRRSEPSTFRPRFKPSATRNIPPSFLRNSHEKFRNRYQLASSRPKSKIIRRPSTSKPELKKPTNPSYTKPKGKTEETVRIVTSKPSDGRTDVWYEIVTLRSLHTFRVGTTQNTRPVTFIKTFTHSITPTAALELSGSEKTDIYEEAPLFENILDDKKPEVATLPPINIDGTDLNSLLKTTTETFRTTEALYKTSVLPVKQKGEMYYHTLTQTYLITRIVSAIKTIPPVEAFEFVPSDSLNEFNTKLLAEGTENEAALLPGEQEYDENKETRVPPPPGFKLSDANLADLVGGKFNPEALEKQMNPQLVAALKTHKNGGTPQLSGTRQTLPNSTSAATPTLSPENLQMAYLRLMNPYMFRGFGGAHTQTVTSSPIVITTDVTTTATRVLRVIFNARPIFKTISSTEVVRTTITSYATKTITPQPALAGLPFGFGAPLPFAAG